ncbi:MAG: cytochrome c peroxidase [Ferruginibacter sp.]
MFKSITSITLIFIAVSITGFSHRNSSAADPAVQVKKNYSAGLDSLMIRAIQFEHTLKQGTTAEIQNAFVKLRASYKRIEVFIEYFFDSYAVVLNGPPIPFFEEKEPYKLSNEPMGMQVMEAYIFPEYDIANKPALQKKLSEMLDHLNSLQGVHAPFEFTEATVFDAFIEEMYRIAALGLTGFDSQTAQNSLPECMAALEGLRDFMSLYEKEFNEKIPGKYQQLTGALQEAISFLTINNNFNTFNRLTFITAYINPVTKITGEYKIAAGLEDNPAGTHYSAINKNNSLFAPDAFNPYKFLDDFTSSPQKIELGRMLFFEKQLSSNNKQSCAGCHKPGKAFTDGLKTSEALDGHSSLKRNAPTLWNAALQRNLFADSRSRSMEDQVLQVLNNAQEMHGSAKEVAGKVLKIPAYSQMYAVAYPAAKEEDAAKNICNAIACYERTLIALNSKFDKHMNGSAVLSKNEVNGFNLFMGKAKCGTCHFMPLFSGAKPPRYYYIETEVLGVPASRVKRNVKLDSDSGRFLITESPVHLFSFKTPSLRNVSLTAPYMHNGVFKTLKEVMEFYNHGGGNGLHIAPQSQTLAFDKLDLNKKEIKDIIAFLHSLTDDKPGTAGH